MHRNVKRLRIKSRMTSQILKKPRLPQDVLGRGIDLPPFAGRCFDECRLYRRHDENPTYEEVCSDKTDMRKRSRSSLIRQKFPTNACSIFFGKITIRQQEIAKVRCRFTSTVRRFLSQRINKDRAFRERNWKIQTLSKSRCYTNCSGRRVFCG